MHEIFAARHVLVIKNQSKRKMELIIIIMIMIYKKMQLKNTPQANITTLV